MGPNSDVELKDLDNIDEINGKLKREFADDKLLHSVLENNNETINNGKIITESINQGLSSFTPDLMFKNLVKNYSIAEKLYGKKLLRFLTGYDPNYLERNIQIPEFQRELREKIDESIDNLKKDKLLDKDNAITDKAIELASVILYYEELDNLISRGDFGEVVHKKHSIYGDKGDINNYKKGDRYRDISVKKSLKTAIRRAHTELTLQDIRVFERESKGLTYIIYAIDSSGSMKGEKIDMCKKAGIALAYKAIENKDKVGLIVFSTKIDEKILPTNDFGLLLKTITKIRASQETNIVDTIKSSIDMFPNDNITKHLILMTDAMPTIGKDPEKDTIKASANAKAAGITISIIGINLDKNGEALAKKIIEISEGRLYMTKNIQEIDKIVLEDYYNV